VDDYLVVLAMVTTSEKPCVSYLRIPQATDTVMSAMHIIVHTSSNLIAPGEDVSEFSQQEIELRVYGSKLILVVEQMQIVTVWLIKSCLLLMYNRMTYVPSAPYSRT
jgi:hypothetical protein